jgi:glycosyltransferase involved in cell wall biosynthesis
MSLRIAITADPYLPVPPRLYGGIERVVALLVAGLVRRGHEVTLIAHPDSQTPAGLIGYGVPPHTGAAARVRELVQVSAALVRLSGAVDVIHSFGRLAALAPVLPMRGVKKIQSYQRPIPWTGVRRAARLGGDSILFTGCSTSLYASANGAAGATPQLGSGQAPRRRSGQARWRTVFNCVDPSTYVAVPNARPDAPLAFLGRIERIKGTHNAIQIAKAAGRRLVIAGNVADQEYFRAEVAPHVDDRLVRYVGEVDDAAKNRVLGEAAALLMPIEWDEPFGIVMAEAFACGTPVIGFPRGSVPEVVRDGVNGFLVPGIAEAVRAVTRLDRIDREAVRRDCEKRFSCDAIVRAYEDIYVEALG